MFKVWCEHVFIEQWGTLNRNTIFHFAILKNNCGTFSVQIDDKRHIIFIYTNVVAYASNIYEKYLNYMYF